MKLTAQQKAYVKLFRQAMKDNTDERGWFNATAVKKVMEDKRTIQKFLESSHYLEHKAMAKQNNLFSVNMETSRGKGGGTLFGPELIPAFSM